MFLLKSLCEKT